jgi:hypothetical protein
MKTYEFEAKIIEGRSGGAFVEIPCNVKEEFGSGGRVKVNATFDGEPYRGSLVPMDEGVHILGIRKAIREEIGKGIGDRVTVTLVRDTARRTVSLPKELRTALARNLTARVAFAKLSYTHKREYAEWVAEAAQDVARRKRVKKTIEKLVKKQ